MTFPVVQSVLDPAALEKAVTALYALQGPIRCRLVSRGMNDIYQLMAGPQRFALKVARTERTDAAFSFEPAFIAHLDHAGFTVPTPLATRQNQPFISVDAPEGPRQIMVTRWLQGTVLTKSMTEHQARQLGAWLARIHQTAAVFQAPVRRPVDNMGKLSARLPALLEMVGHDPAMAMFLTRAADMIRGHMARLDGRAVPYGICHGDFNYTNLMELADQSIAVLDFSDSGEDFLVSDIAAFFWRADVDGVGDVLNPAFVAGYEALRALTPAEKAVLPLFRAARHLGLAASFAQHVNRVGPIAGFDENRRYYLSMIRLYCAEARVG